MRLAVLGVILATCACSTGARQVGFDVSFGPSVRASEVRHVVVGVHHDVTCGDAAYWTSTIERASQTSASPPPIADAVGVSAVALDDACRVIAEACTSASARSTAVALELVDVSRECVAEECTACASDAGATSTDASTFDGGPTDAGASDTGQADDASEDAYELDECFVRERCRNSIDDDCNGLADCEDPACSAVVGCDCMGCVPP